MKRLKLLFVPLLILSGCQTANRRDDTKIPEIKEVPIEHDYSEISGFRLSWATMFDSNLEDYYVYFYSETCSKCEEIKNYVIEKALQNQNIYFVKSSSCDQLAEDISTSIGATKSTNMVILGYPSLIKIQNHICTKNVAGKKQITELLK